MRAHLWKKGCLFMVLLPLLWGCGDSVGGIRQGVLSPQGQGDVGPGIVASGGTVPVRILVDGGTGTATSRTIAPEHLTPDDLGDTSKYTLTMDGHSDMGGSVAVQNFTLRDGRGILALSPGAWTLRLTATDVATSTQFLSGSTLLIVQDAPTTTSITLTPLTGTGTVSVQFTIPQSVVQRLDQTNGQRQVTVALYNQQNQVVQGTSQTFTVAAGMTNPASISYTANGSPVAAGRYELRLTATYTVNNASTGNQPVAYNLGWSDILYVEGNRESVATVDIPEAGTAMGVPGNPYRQDKVGQSVTAPTVNFVQATTSNPGGEMVWLYGAAWDGLDTNTNGNEVLVVDWDPVYDADYYEVELLVHPFTKAASQPASNGKFSKVVTTDAEWDAVKNTTFIYSGQSKTPTYLRYSGGTGDPDYYQTRTYDISCVSSANVVTTFTSCADKNLARTLFASGTKNENYRVAATQDAFDTYTDWSYNVTNRGKVGLEGDCGVLGVLLPAYTPQVSVAYRVRGVNRYGHSDWVYWKGGKW